MCLFLAGEKKKKKTKSSEYLAASLTSGTTLESQQTKDALGYQSPRQVFSTQEVFGRSLEQRHSSIFDISKYKLWWIKAFEGSKQGVLPGPGAREGKRSVLRGLERLSPQTQQL